MRRARLGVIATAAVVIAAASVGVGVALAATPLTVGSGWQQFNWVGQTQPVEPVQTPYTFTTTKAVTLAITDVGCPGEVFTVYDNGVLLGRTTPPTVTTCAYPGATNDPDAALADETYSGGVGTLKPGTHSIRIIVSTAPFENGGAFIRVDSKKDVLALESNRTVKRKKFFG
jgi:hypothetical protein